MIAPRTAARMRRTAMSSCSAMSAGMITSG
jgi:hypothetical protein